METAADRRKRKLAKLCDSHGGTEGVAAASGLNPFALEQVLKGVLGEPRKDGTRVPRSLGSRAARAIEAAFKLGTGWFDAPDTPPRVGEEAMAIAVAYERMNQTERQRLRLLMLAARDAKSPTFDPAPNDPLNGTDGVGDSGLGELAPDRPSRKRGKK